MMSAKIKQIDTALKRYYQSLHQDYDGVFLVHCEANGLGIMYYNNIELIDNPKYFNFKH